ncbi:hypothetical protein THOM_1973 [Trachipleistophora hominis]|uniref:Uncharacterized protein n=1 Tax=Trachipleistophora hominis TaxID=72359 RepID=L7JUU5_TRAHO|nr:hypothetical protein THOM_1973 [Trachipleistophora hominis]
MRYRIRKSAAKVISSKKTKSFVTWTPMENERHFLVEVENKTSKLIDILPKVDDKISFINLYLYRNSHMKYDLEENKNVLTPYYDMLNVHSQVILYKFIERYPNGQCSDGYRSRDKVIEGERDEQAQTVKKNEENHKYRIENETRYEKNVFEHEKGIVEDVQECGASDTRILEKLGENSKNDHNINTNRAEVITCCTSSWDKNNDGMEKEAHNNTFDGVVSTKNCKLENETNEYVDTLSYLRDGSESNDEEMNKTEFPGLNIREMKKKLKNCVVNSVSSPECADVNKSTVNDDCAGVSSGYANFEEGLIKEYVLKSQNFHQKYILQIKNKTLIFKILFDHFIVYYRTNNEYAKYLLDKMIILISEYEIGMEESNLRALSVVMKDNNELTFVLGAFMSGREDLFNGLIMEKKYKNLFMKMKNRRDTTKRASTLNTITVADTVDPVSEVALPSKTHNFEILNIPTTLQQTLQEVQKGALPINFLLFHLNSANTRTIRNYMEQLFSVLLNNIFHPTVLKLLMMRTREYKTVIAHFFSFQSYGTQRVIILECLMMLVDDGWELSAEMIRMFFMTMDSTTLKFNEILEERIVAFYEKMKIMKMI